MPSYIAPLEDMKFTLDTIAKLPDIRELPAHREVGNDLVDAILNASASFTGEVLAPLNAVGDQQGVKVNRGEVTTADGFVEAYRQYADNGWPSLPISPDYDGQGLPEVINTAAMEMVMSANLAFSLCPMLTQGALKTLQAHAPDALKHTLLPKMASGLWTGSMDLTEPQAGSDLSTVKTRALPTEDPNIYRIQGQKIFISWGDHDMAENVIHLVLGRLPDAPEGTRGISLFAVPKFLVNDDGSLGERNDLYTVSTEEKLGQHGSPTCVLAYGDNGGALGYLIGEPNRGLACMFTMMNHARINVGMQGLGLAERALQQGKTYAAERVQGKLSIIEYPDVKRMVMMMQSGCSAMRAMVYMAMGLVDLCESQDQTMADLSYRRLQLLTPIVKAWCTDLTQEITSLNIQIHGGVGFVEETGAAQFYRDARILPIYEGTNGIQANDLVGRKVLADSGDELHRLLAEIETDLEVWLTQPELQISAQQLASCVALAKSSGDAVLTTHNNGHDWRAVASYFLELHGWLIGAWLLHKKAAAACNLQEKLSDSYCKDQLENLKNYTMHFLPRVHGLSAAIAIGL
jgi:alkylation response protein AidB-like acyl-CoA dehydrogenase